MKLTIQNINKLVNTYIESKWLPSTKGCKIESIDETHSSYLFKLSNGDSNDWQINIERESNQKPFPKWEIWGWGSDGYPKRRELDKGILKDMDKTRLHFAILFSEMVSIDSGKVRNAFETLIKHIDEKDIQGIDSTF